MDFSWKIVIDAGIISAALLLATFLRAKLHFLQRLMVPNALTAGFILLPIYNFLFPYLGYTVNKLGDLVYHLLNLSFIAMTLRANPKQKKKKRWRCFSYHFSYFIPIRPTSLSWAFAFLAFIYDHHAKAKPRNRTHPPPRLFPRTRASLCDRKGMGGNGI